MIFRILIWFNPWIPLIMDERIIVELVINEFFKIIISITIGAIFCQVSINKQLLHDRPSITSGSHQWNGAIPSFIKIENWMTIIIKKSLNKFFSIIKIEKIKTVEANLWTKKYFILASLEQGLFFFTIKGIIDRRLISIPIHIINQEYAEITINDLNIRELKNKIL